MSSAGPGSRGVRPSRRQLLAGAATATAVGGGALWWGTRDTGPAVIPLYAETVAFTSPSDRVEIAPGDVAGVRPGTRVASTASSSVQLLADQRSWIDGAPAWVRTGPYADLATSALLDLWVLTRGLPAPVAGWTPKWRYVWPRDASAVAVVLARVGRYAEARAALLWLQERQRADGWFEARYDPSTGRAPDGRPRQLDGTGWVLWAADRIVRTRPTGDRPGEAEKLRALITTSCAGIHEALDPVTGLPPVSPDYWEVDEDTVTLGTVAPLAAGLEAATRLLPLLGASTTQVDADAANLRRGISAEFAAYDWPRHARDDDPDCATAMLQPPFRERTDTSALAGLGAAIPRMTRPAGGLAPGTSWHHDGVSWTPETALVAAALAGAGDNAGARHWLDWLREHRTTAGSLPEKVLADGSPAAVAPLAWTAALTLLAIEACVG